MKKMIKRILLFLLAFLLVFLLVSWVIPSNMLEDRADSDMPGLFLAFAALSGTLLGFVISSMSILAGLRTDETMDKLVRTGHYPMLMRNFFSTGVLLFVSMIFAIVSFFWSNIFMWKSGFAMFILSILGLAVAGYRFYFVINSVSKKGKKKSMWPEPNVEQEDG